MAQITTSTSAYKVNNGKIKRWIFLLVLLMVSACAVSPTGRRQLMLISPQQAITASKNAYVQTLAPLEQSGKIDSNIHVADRVRRITGRIIAQTTILFPETAEWQWDVRVIDDPDTINAWCMAGGKMAVYTGLLSQVKPSDDELAQVMGHEIAHAIANHTAEKMSVALASSIGLTTVGIVSGGNNGSNATLAGATLAAGLAIQLPNSRKAEEEADRIGIELAARAGYDPRAAETLWQKMNEAGSSDTPEFLSTHPNPMNRITTLRELAPSMMVYFEEAKERPIHTFPNQIPLEPN